MKKIIRDICADRKHYMRLVIILLLLMIYYLLLMCTFSFFTSTDEVTNRLFAKNIGLELYEPGWDGGGSTMAASFEPGMIIPKDPYAVNTGSLDMLVRFKMEIRLSESTAWLPYGNSTELLSPADDTQRKISLLRSVEMADGTPLLTIKNDAQQSENGNYTVVRADNGKSYCLQYCPSYQDMYSNLYGDFLVEAAEGNGTETFDLYFYYIGKNPVGGFGNYTADPQGNRLTSEQTQMSVLSPGMETPRLFDKIVCPIYKKDYLTVFDQGNHINISVEGILLEDFDNVSLPYTVENFKRLASV